MEQVIEAILAEIDDLTIHNAMRHRVFAQLEEIVPTVVLKEMCVDIANREASRCAATGCRSRTERFLQRPCVRSVSTENLRIKRRKDER